MVRPVFDTNILIDFLNGIPQARIELERYEDRSISIVTWMEVLVGADAAVEAETREFLKGFEVIDLDDAVAERAVSLRRSRLHLGLIQAFLEKSCTSRPKRHSLDIH